MEEEKYNGWTNFETWKLALNLDNDECWYKALRKERINLIDGNALKEWCEQISEEKNTTEINEVGIWLSDFWSWNEWKEVNFDEVLKSIKEK